MSKTVHFAHSRLHAESDETEFIITEEYIQPQVRKTNSYMSTFEYTALIVARILQLTSPGGAPLISMSELGNDLDPLSIATREIRMRLPSLVIRRTLNDGSIEDWLLNDKTNVLAFPRI